MLLCEVSRNVSEGLKLYLSPVLQTSFFAAFLYIFTISSHLTLNMQMIFVYMFTWKPLQDVCTCPRKCLFQCVCLCLQSKDFMFHSNSNQSALFVLLGVANYVYNSFVYDVSCWWKTSWARTLWTLRNIINGWAYSRWLFPEAILGWAASVFI